MTDFDREPGAIDDPSGPGGQDVDVRNHPPGDTADDVGDGEPEVSELTLPGPDDPVAWNYVEAGTQVIGPNGDTVGSVVEMLGTDEGIFHGVAVDPQRGSGARMVPSSQVTLLTPSRVQIALDADALAEAEEYQPRD